MIETNFSCETSLAARVCRSPNFEARRGGCLPDMLLLHYTGMASAEKAVAWLAEPASRVSAHYVIDEAGGITQMVSEAMRAWHAGVAHWAGADDINSCSIGIEIHNPGHDAGYPDFPPVQVLAVRDLCLDISKRHNIPARRVLAHSDVAPRRKRDPGEKFDWRWLASQGVGHWVEPLAPAGDAGLGPGDRGNGVMRLQRQLRTYGYWIEAHGSYDEHTAFAVTAFQRHFRPALVNGRADRSTVETLDKLIAAEAPCVPAA